MTFENIALNQMTFRSDLDPDFVPAFLWNRAYRENASQNPESTPIKMALLRKDGSVFSHSTKILPHTSENQNINLTFVERILKFLLWQKGGNQILISDPTLAKSLNKVYSQTGERHFDSEFIGKKVFDQPITVEFCDIENFPNENQNTSPLGRNLDGYRIGFDLGGSDRKCAAVVNGDVVFSEEIEWNPYFQNDPQYHIDGIRDSLKRAAEKLPQVDAIGGSAAGVYVNNEVRGGSLFRGISDEDFEKHIRHLFLNLKKEWNDIPFEVANDGEVAALAGSMELGDNSVLGISMGTSFAAGYVTPEGNITNWLNELAFVPVDYRKNAPVDEWSGDHGCGVQYFSQQAVARLAKIAGFNFPQDMPFPEQLIQVQKAMSENDTKARKVFETIGIYLGYSLPLFAKAYDLKNLLIMGRVTSGLGGEIIIETAKKILSQDFSELGDINLCTPSEKNKRHGQAIAAASLPQRNIQ